MNPNQYISPPTTTNYNTNRAWPTQPRILSIDDTTTPMESTPTSIPITTGNRSPQNVSSPMNTPLAPIPYPGAITTPPTVFESMLMGSIPCQAIYSDDVCGAVVDANAQVLYLQHIYIYTYIYPSKNLSNIHTHHIYII